MLGVTRFLLSSWPRGVTQAGPRTLRPHRARHGGHEVLHGDDGLVVGESGDVEDRVPGDQVDVVTPAGVRYPGRDDQGPR